MRIGVDARELCGRATGAGRYLHGLLAAWSTNERARRHEYVLYAPEPLTVPLDARRFATRVIPGRPGTWWEQLRLPRVAAHDHLDLFFAPAYTAPLTLRMPVVVTMHDVSFAAHPEWFSTREGMRRRWLSRRTARAARAIITVSRFSKREIVDHLGVAETHVHVVPQGIVAPAPPRTPLPRRPLVLYVGSIFNRRRVPDLIRAFVPVARAHRDASLEIVGDDRSHPRQDIAAAIASAGLKDRVAWRQYVPDDELGGLYASARAFAFLSEYEGLGMTPLEALAAGVPPLLLDTPVARESCEEAALYVPAGDLAGAAGALESLLFDEAVRSRLLAAAPRVLAKYQWPRAAEETLAVLERSA
jgi:glycosyltransferase involved in cell wall biosynthesis